MASKINWKKGDYIRLGRAVSDFNKKINKLNAVEKKLYLPELESYQELKETITTRAELNRVINSLKRFQEKGAEELYVTQAGEEITKWQRKELGIQSRIAQRRLQQELKQYNVADKSGFTRAQMGSQRAKEIKASIESLKQIESKKGYDFNRLVNRITYFGRSDLSMKRAITFKENYLDVLKKYEGFDNYDLLMKKLNSFSNPESFFEFVNKDEITVDLTYQSNQTYTQEAFNSYIERLGIEIEIDSVT